MAISSFRRESFLSSVGMSKENKAQQTFQRYAVRVTYTMTQQVQQSGKLWCYNPID